MGGVINGCDLYTDVKDIPDSSPVNNEQYAINTNMVNFQQLAQAIADAIPGGGDGLKCVSNVINLVAGVPLTVTLGSMSEICSVETENSNGNRIYLSRKISGNQITFCATANLNNILYRAIGE